jgi:AraC family transcriptional regulator
MKKISNKILRLKSYQKIAALSPFYLQRLFTRLVKKPVFEYIKLRRLARACRELKSTKLTTLEIAINLGFGSRESFTRNFKTVYGITPSSYRHNRIMLNHYDKPDLALNYAQAEVGVPFYSDGVIIELNYQILVKEIAFLGVKDYWSFEAGKMLGERPGISTPSLIVENFLKVYDSIPKLKLGRSISVSYPGDAPCGFSSFFAGAEADPMINDSNFEKWILPTRDYLVCRYETQSFSETISKMGIVHKFIRKWLKEHGLRADTFFPDLTYPDSVENGYIEMWIPFLKR